MNKKAIFITVRTGSSRLPKKALLKIGKLHTIEYVINNAKKSEKADLVVLCTTTLKEDDVLCKIAKKNNIEIYRGSVEDKLERWNQAAKKFQIDFFITADGDDLFCSSELMDLAFDQYERNNSEFIQGQNLACGTFTYGISSKTLSTVCKNKKSTDTEMMWVYFTETGVCTVENLENVPAIFIRNNVRMTLDYEEDLLFFKTVIERLNGFEVNTRNVLSLLDKDQSLINLNYFMKDKWKENQVNKTKLVYSE